MPYSKEEDKITHHFRKSNVGVVIVVIKQQLLSITPVAVAFVYQFNGKKLKITKHTLVCSDFLTFK